MKIIPKKEIQDYALPLFIFSSFHLADAISKDGEEFDLFIVLDKKHVEQLKKLSLDKKDEELSLSYLSSSPSNFRGAIL